MYNVHTFSGAGVGTGVFENLKTQATTDSLKQLTSYIEGNWIQGSVFTPSDWSVYGKAIRTNNDIEGWHHGLNRRAGGRVHLPFYMLVQLLDGEARLAALQVKLVSQRKMKRLQRKKYRNLQGKIFSFWEDYKNGKKTSLELLNACSHLNAPLQAH